MFPLSRLMVAVALASLLVAAPLPSRAEDWPQWRGTKRDGVWRENGLIDQFASPQLACKWRVPIGSGYAGPTVAEGRVYVSDRLVEPNEVERVHCFDWRTGATVWTHVYDCPYEGFSYRAGPRASVLVEQGRAYSLGASGRLFCFQAAAGAVIWARDLNADYKIRMPNWGIAASPLVEGELLIVQIGGEDNACVVALNKHTGAETWRALGDDASYSAPIVIDQAGRRVLVVWTGQRIVGLDPADGRLLWEYPFRWEQWPIGIATPVHHQDLLLVSEAHKGSLLLRLGAASTTVEKVWHRRKEEVENGEALHCLISTPFIRDGYLYGADGNGVLRCLTLGDGEQVWEDRTAVPENRWAAIHLVPNGDRVWLFNERGELLIAQLSPEGFREISRAKLIDPTTDQLRQRGGVAWSHPAFAHRHVFARTTRSWSAPTCQLRDGGGVDNRARRRGRGDAARGDA